MDTFHKPATREDIQDFANWLRSQDGKHFEIQDSFNCPIAQYLQARGQENIVVGMAEVLTGHYPARNMFILPDEMKTIVYGDIIVFKPGERKQASAVELYQRAVNMLENMPA